MTVNKVILVGNLGQDPEVRTTAGGMQVATLRIATSERRKDQSGNWTDHTEWHRVVVFGRTAENVGKFLKKGRQIYVEGKLRTQKWQDREGKDRWTTEVLADDVRFLGGGDRGEGGARPSYGGGGGGGGGTGGGGQRSYGGPPAPSAPAPSQASAPSGASAPSVAPSREDGPPAPAPDDMPYQPDEDIPF